ncbi:MAG TPA: preprotein translocase subunit SecG [Aquabacterium sp.]|uniref:preprotein translocase subunit SecG n=1 Tax=Aquabacterium sp. TaxID=1872578 RepID=UPI002E379E32|nr:preprotein translocase subunit SecG [Aquabacterium sp.]HEX5374289.1 preprotein translocase subunit SecG [Aquabacterium sp.]
MQQLFLTLALVIQVLSALAIIGLVLVQHGKGADMGASFGSGASGSLFGATGSANVLSKSTAVAATFFFASTLALAYMGNSRPQAPKGSVLDQAASAALLAPSSPVAASAASAVASGAALIPKQ